jgi:hypothetical protein
VLLQEWLAQIQAWPMTDGQPHEITQLVVLFYQGAHVV